MSKTTPELSGPPGSKAGFQPGDLIAERYQVVRRLAVGGMGEVFLAEQIVLKRRVVVKVTRTYSSVEGIDERFRREALGLGKLHHRNIVTVHDYGAARGIHYLVMEYVEGETLEDRLEREGPTSFEEFVPIAAQILDGLGHAHAHDIIHRDLKPSNVMLAREHGVDNYVKLLDFGLAKQVHSTAITHQDKIVGSACYVAPEIILKREDVDQRSDVYSLGVLFYRMLAGELPYGNGDARSSLFAHIIGQPVPLREREGTGALPAYLCELVHHCLQKEPGDRPDDARHVRALLLASLEDPQLAQGPWSSVDELAQGPRSARSSGQYTAQSKPKRTRVETKKIQRPAAPSEESKERAISHPPKRHGLGKRAARGTPAAAAASVPLYERALYVLVGLVLGAVLTLLAIAALRPEELGLDRPAPPIAARPAP